MPSVLFWPGLTFCLTRDPEDGTWEGAISFKGDSFRAKALPGQSAAWAWANNIARKYWSA